MSSKAKKGIVIAVVCCLLFALLMGGLFFWIFKTANAPLAGRYDDPAFLAGKTNTSVATVYIGSQNGSEIRATAKYFNGIKDIWTIWAKGGEQISFTHGIEASEGRAKLVLVLPDETVIDLSAEQSPYTFTAPEGNSGCGLWGTRRSFPTCWTPTGQVHPPTTIEKGVRQCDRVKNQTYNQD